MVIIIHSSIQPVSFLTTGYFFFFKASLSWRAYDHHIVMKCKIECLCRRFFFFFMCITQIAYADQVLGLGGTLEGFGSTTLSLSLIHCLYDIMVISPPVPHSLSTGWSILHHALAFSIYLSISLKLFSSAAAVITALSRHCLYTPQAPFAFTSSCNLIFHGFRIVVDSAPVVTDTATATVQFFFSVINNRFYTVSFNAFLNCCANYD